MRRCLIALGGVIPTLAIAAHGCKTATEVTLDLRTNVKCEDLKGIDIVVAQTSFDAESRAALVSENTTRFPTATTADCKDGRIGTLVITPSGSEGAVVVIAGFGTTPVEKCKAGKIGNECIVARRRFGFIDNEQPVLPVVLDIDCAGVPCNASSTCVSKKCVDSEVHCEGATCGQPGKVGPDGGVIEEDGSPPIPPAPPPQPPVGEAGPDAPSDGSKDGSIDAPSEGGVALLCTDGARCGSGNQACPGASSCCYSPPSGTCTTLPCNTFQGCCRDSRDCADTNNVCCAVPANLSKQTTFTCMDFAMCQAATGQPICYDTVSQAGCGSSGLACKGSAYTSAAETEPPFFACS
jgi:hypothetical protein